MRRGLWGTYWICVLLVALFSAGATAQNRDDGVRRERRIALVIGNADYNEARLRNSVNDARAIAEALRRAGFEVIVKENADRLTMYEAIIAFVVHTREPFTVTADDVIAMTNAHVSKDVIKAVVDEAEARKRVRRQEDDYIPFYYQYYDPWWFMPRYYKAGVSRIATWSPPAASSKSSVRSPKR